MHAYCNQDTHEEDGELNTSQEPVWKIKQQRKNFRKKIFGDHYNYNYRRQNQHKMYRIQENRNTEIERQNRILLEKIQSIFKRSLGRQKAASLKNSQSRQSTVHDQVIKTRIRQSTQIIGQEEKKIQILRTSKKRINTESIIEKKKMKKMLPLPNDSRVTKRLNQVSDSHITPTKRKTISHKVILYKGKYEINNCPFKFLIFVQGQTYTIIAEQQNSEISEQINIPYEDYKILYKKYLKYDHSAILDYLQVNVENGLLELVGFESKMMDIIQYGEIPVEISQKVDQKEDHITPLLRYDEMQKRKAASEVGKQENSLIVEKDREISVQQSSIVKKKQRRKYKYSSNIFNLNISPEQQQEKGKLSNFSSQTKKDYDEASLEPQINDEVPEEIQ